MEIYEAKKVSNLILYFDLFEKQKKMFPFCLHYIYYFIITFLDEKNTLEKFHTTRKPLCLLETLHKRYFKEHIVFVFQGSSKTF